MAQTKPELREPQAGRLWGVLRRCLKVRGYKGGQVSMFTPAGVKSNVPVENYGDAAKAGFQIAIPAVTPEGVKTGGQTDTATDTSQNQGSENVTEKIG